MPQCSTLGPLLCLLYIHYIINDLQSQIKLFADDTSLFLIVDHPDTAARNMHPDIDTLSTWSGKWLVRLGDLVFYAIVQPFLVKYGGQFPQLEEQIVPGSEPATFH